GAGATKVIIAHGSDLVFAKTINLGGRHMDQALSRRLKYTLGEARAKRLAAKTLTLAPLTARTPAPSETDAAADEGGGGMALLSAAMAKHDGAGPTPAA